MPFYAEFKGDNSSILSVYDSIVLLNKFDIKILNEFKSICDLLLKIKNLRVENVYYAASGLLVIHFSTSIQGRRVKLSDFGVSIYLKPNEISILSKRFHYYDEDGEDIWAFSSIENINHLSKYLQEKENAYSTTLL